MSVQKRNIFGATDPYAPPPTSATVQSTDGALNGPVHQCGGNYDTVRDPRDSERAYREAQSASWGVHEGGSPGLALPTGVDEFHTQGQPFDQSTGVAGGEFADHSLVTRDDGSVNFDDSNQTAGGRPVA